MCYIYLHSSKHHDFLFWKWEEFPVCFGSLPARGKEGSTASCRKPAGAQSSETQLLAPVSLFSSQKNSNPFCFTSTWGKNLWSQKKWDGDHCCQETSLLLWCLSIFQGETVSSKRDVGTHLLLKLSQKVLKAACLEARMRPPIVTYLKREQW